MSHPRLVQFLTKLRSELEGFEDYRKELDRQPQTFVFHKRTLLNETIKQLKKGSKITLSSKEKSKLAELVNEAGNQLHKDLEKIQGGTLPRPGGKTTLRFTNHTDVPIPKGYKEFLPYTAFSRVKFAYRDAMNNYFLKMQDYLRNETSHDVVRTKSGEEKRSILFFFDAGHEDKAGVYEKFLDKKTLKIMSEMDKVNETMSNDEMRKLQKELDDFKIDINLQKLDDSDTIIIKIESTSVNRSRGQKSGLRSRKLNKKIKNLLSKQKLSKLESSDSIEDRKAKQVRKAATDPFKKLGNKNVKVKANDLKEKKAGKKPASVKSKTKVKGRKTRLNTAIRVAKPARKRKNPRTSTNNLLQMIGLINKKLPGVVRKNMVAPRLENQTGRFAQSVRVTEVVQTPQGFPSVGYTYQKNPYQVFEEGSTGNWANGDRDPRDLIDKSIREIAATMAIGRFYTRRV